MSAFTDLRDKIGAGFSSMWATMPETLRAFLLGIVFGVLAVGAMWLAF